MDIFSNIWNYRLNFKFTLSKSRVHFQKVTFYVYQSAFILKLQQTKSPSIWVRHLQTSHSTMTLTQRQRKGTETESALCYTLICNRDYVLLKGLLLVCSLQVMASFTSFFFTHCMPRFWKLKQHRYSQTQTKRQKPLKCKSPH